MRKIEKANPNTPYSVFGDAQWTNKDRLSDALLKDLIEHFSRVSFGNRIAPDLLGDAYAYLIKKFADATNATPKQVADEFSGMTLAGLDDDRLIHAKVGGHGCSYSTGETIAIVIGLILGIIPGLVLLVVLC